jgi:1-acyl-sn-glycerol-3-phosphate acyltransferase
MDDTALQHRSLTIGESRPGRLTYSFCRSFIRTVVNRLYRVEVHDIENLAIPGPAIIAPVHRSLLDIPIIGSASGRRIKTLSKIDLFSPRPLAWFLSALGGYPVRRGTADREALRISMMLLDRGEMMMVYPEGTRGSGPEVGSIFDGCAYLAAKTGARVIPVGIAGTENAMPKNKWIPRFTKVVIHVGEPLDPPIASTGRVTKGDRQLFSEALRVELQKLFTAARLEAGDRAGES